MPEFTYRAANAQGVIQQGVIDAPGRDQALRQLRAKGLTPVTITEGQAQAAAKPSADVKLSRRAARKAPGHADIHNFTSELSVMLRAGLPLDRALRVLISMSRLPSFTTVLDDIFRAVKSGKSFSQALAPHQALFGDFYINMVRSGEAGGQLAGVLSSLAEHLERLKALRESVISALIYPVILLVVAALSVVMMLGFVVPQFETLFADMGDALPLPTRIIVQLGDLIGQWGWALLIGTIVVVSLVRSWLRSPSGRAWKDARLLKIPVVGTVVRKYEITRFTRSMGTLLGNGVPIVRALGIASATMGNQVMRQALDGVGPAIKRGGRLADALEQSGLFTPLVLNMVRLGEETGRLDEMLLEVARVHDGEVQAGVKRVLTLVEPALILLLGGVIAAIIVSILMGILSVNELVM